MCRFAVRLAATVFAMALQPVRAADVESTITQLSKIQLDRAQVYSVRDITLDRDIFSITLNRGTIAFTEPVDGKVTGAVFVGSGDILAIPSDAIEKRQLFRYTKSALLSEHFETAVFRFTDGLQDDLLKEYRKHAPDTPDASDVEQVLRWESEVQRRAAFLNDRILADLLSSRTHPFFLAQIEGSRLGWFDAVYDELRTEEVFLQQNAGGTPLMWVSLNKRSETRDPASAAHDDKSIVEITSTNQQAGLVHLKWKVDGERVVELPISSGNVARLSLEDGSAVPFMRSGDRLVVILPAGSKAGEAVALRIESAVEGGVTLPAAAVRRPGTLVPASYRDQWIIEGLAGYAAAATQPNLLGSARNEILGSSADGGTFESRGPLWIGYRVMQPDMAPAAMAAQRAKSVWVIHMLRHLVLREQSEASFTSLVDELLAEFQSKPISTFDFKKLAEKHVGMSLDWFFDDWVFGTGVPSYTLTYKVDAAAGGFEISGDISQSGVPDTFEMPVPLYADDKFLGNVRVSNDGGEFRFLTPIRPQQVLMDPRKTILTRD